MLKHNLLLIFRNFKRDKSSFVINLIGLSSGLACALLIFFWVNDELSVDRFFENDKQLFQVMQNTLGTNGTETIDATPGHLAEALSDEIPEVEYAVAVVPGSFNISKGIVSTSDKQIRSVGQYVSEDFFNVFAYKILYGNRNTMLSAQNSVVISRELALKLYGSSENAVGKVVDWKAQEIEGKYTVSGVFDLPDERATNQFDVLLNYKLFEGANPWEGWGSSSPYTYALLKKGTSSDLFNEKIRDFIKSRDKSLKATLVAQRYSDRYLHGRYENGKPAGGRIEYVRLFSVIAIFIGLAILISCLGLFGLAAFTAGQRTKEIGIRKVLGSGVVEITQLLSGDFTRMVIIAIVIALPVSYLIADRWLESFAYRIELEWWYFAAAGLMTLLIAWFTVGMQTVKAALVNPVEALRYE
jgi:putative ABC transport system permease protein